MEPVLGLMASPGGSPTAAYFSVPLPLALIDRETDPPSLVVWSAGVVMEMAPPTFHVNACVATYDPDAAETVTAYGPPAAAPAATVPVIDPVDVLIDRPPGRPLAE